MKLVITDDCISCGACEIECPVNAIYPKVNPGLRELILINDISSYSGFISDTHYYINPYECTGCQKVFSAPRCNLVCPVACCLNEKEFYESGIVMMKNNVLITKT